MTATSTTSAGTVPSTPPQAPPKMGGQLLVEGKTIAFTGGKPKADWTGLKNSAAAPANPHCVRFPMGTSDETKAYSRRTAAPTKLLKRGDDLTAYLLKVSEHVRIHGLDTTLYVPSMIDKNAMVFLPDAFDQVTFSHVSEKAQDYKENHWDKFDKENDDATKTYLKNTLGEELEEKLRLRATPSDTSVEVLYRITHLLEDQSSEKFNRLQANLKALSPLKEPGQDVSKYVDKARPICNKLFQALNHTPTLFKLQTLPKKILYIHYIFRIQPTDARESQNNALITMGPQEHDSAI